jgi:hypothetical protein
MSFWHARLAGSREEVAWEKVLQLLVVNRLLDPNDATLRKFLGDSSYYTAKYLQQKAATDDALRNCLTARNILQRLSTADPSDVWTRGWLGFSDLQIGNVLVAKRKLSAALANFGSAITIFEPLREASATNVDILAGLAS